MKDKLREFCAEEEEIVWTGARLDVSINTFELNKFYELIGDDYFEEGGQLIEWQGDRVVVDLTQICEFFDINPQDIYPES